MISIIITIYCLITVALIFISKRENKVFCVLFFYLIVPPEVRIGDIQAKWFISFAIFFWLISYGRFFQQFKFVSLYKPISIFIIAMFTIGLFDQRLSIINKFLRPLMSCLDSVLLIPFVYFNYVNHNTNFANIYKKILISLFIFTLYGVYCYLTSTNPYISEISKDYGIRDFSADFMQADDGRFRISSFSFHPYLFSLLMIFAALILLAFRPFNSKSIFSGIQALFIFLLYTVNIYFTDSRTTFLIFLFVMSAILLYKITFKRLIFYVFLIPALYVSIMQFSATSNAIDKVLDIFTTGGTQLTGSSVSMRQDQLLISLGYFYKSPIYGNGFNYLVDNLKFSSDKSKRQTDADAYGFESYLFILLIEQGILGILANIFIFYGLIKLHTINLFRVTSLDQKLTFSNLLIAISYIIFIFATGTLNSMPIFFLLMGISLSHQTISSSQPFHNQIRSIYAVNR